MAAKLWKSEAEAITAMERSFRNIDFIKGQFRHGMGRVEITDAIGMSLYRDLKTICEAALYLVDCSKADPEGTIEFPQMKDLKKYGDCVDATPEAEYAAQGICDIKKAFEEGPITPQMLRILLEMVDVFLDWAQHELREFEGRIPFFLERFRDIEETLFEDMSFSFIKNTEPNAPRRMYFLDVGDKDLDSMTDEEIDELYRPQNENSRKSIVAFFIYMILKEYSSEEYHYYIEDIRRILKSEYELEIGRAAVGRYLRALAKEEKSNIWMTLNKKGGYWYSERKPSWLE